MSENAKTPKKIFPIRGITSCLPTAVYPQFAPQNDNRLYNKQIIDHRPKTYLCCKTATYPSIAIVRKRPIGTKSVPKPPKQADLEDWVAHPFFGFAKKGGFPRYMDCWRTGTYTNHKTGKTESPGTLLDSRLRENDKEYFVFFDVETAGVSTYNILVSRDVKTSFASLRTCGPSFVRTCGRGLDLRLAGAQGSCPAFCVKVWWPIPFLALQKRVGSRDTWIVGARGHTATINNINDVLGLNWA
ncbi:MAG: hypothetical protein R3F48_05950 [Candidatus Zixiibacteriota bacterium]